MTLDEYRSTITGRLRFGTELDSVVSGLSERLRICEPREAYPERSESLHSWLREISRSRHERTLMLVLGQSQGREREVRDRRASDDNKLTAAGMSDGAGGALAAVGLLRQVGMPESLGFEAGLDAWRRTLDMLDKADLVVVGTGDVNLYAAFLHGLIHETYFGYTRWPPVYLEHYQRVTVAGERFNRYSQHSPEGHYGVIALIKNPWNPNLRLLWIAGLSGIATHSGCRLVATGWREYELQARNAIGVVYTGVSDGIARPQAWLVRYRGDNDLTWGRID